MIVSASASAPSPAATPRVNPALVLTAPRTLLAGVLMSDQLDEDAGNLWVWPGTHLTHGEYFRQNGPDAFFEAAGYPPIRLPEPEQIRG
jgi:hypothetical protein